MTMIDDHGCLPVHGHSNVVGAVRFQRREDVWRRDHIWPSFSPSLEQFLPRYARPRARGCRGKDHALTRARPASGGPPRLGMPHARAEWTGPRRERLSPERGGLRTFCQGSHALRARLGPQSVGCQEAREAILTRSSLAAILEPVPSSAWGVFL
jgi:hypothetical protein